MTLKPGIGNASDDPDVMIDINTTPLIDVMLVLLIMLIITLPVQLHSVNLDIAADVARPAQAADIVSIGIGRDGRLTWNGEDVGRPLLETRVREAARRALQPELHLRADPAASYDDVIAVLAAAQRNGIARIGILASSRSPD